MEVRVNCSTRQHKSGKKEETECIYFSPATNYPAAQCLEEEEEWWPRTKGCSVSKCCAPRWELCAHNSQGFGFTKQMNYMSSERLGHKLLLPNATGAVSCYCCSAFCFQAGVTVRPELVPYWRLILGEREKSGQYGSH